MAAFKALGRWVDGSGWTQALVNASRTRRAHQLTRKAYAEYFESYESKGKSQTLNEWKEEKLKKCPQFLYWASVVNLELLWLQLVRAFRGANFSLYLKAIRELLPWMFALGQKKGDVTIPPTLLLVVDHVCLTQRMTTYATFSGLKRLTRSVIASVYVFNLGASLLEARTLQ